jgi:extradiol dioxygenase family protein
MSVRQIGRDVSTARLRFHLVFPVQDLEAARGFYGGLLGRPEGSISTATNRGASRAARRPSTVNPVDGEKVPVRHFGVILAPDWESLTVKLRQARVRFLIEPQLRFRDFPAEQATCSRPKAREAWGLALPTPSCRPLP